MDLKRNEPWIQNLVREEESQETSLFSKDVQIEKRTRECLDQFKSFFENFVKQFNDLKRNEAECIHIYNMSDCKSDFMLLRNTSQLVFAQDSKGIIRITFIKKTNGGLSEERSASYLDSHWNPHLGTLNWKYRDQSAKLINLEEICKHYLEKFVRESFSL